MIDLFLPEQKCRIQSTNLAMDGITAFLKENSYSFCLIVSDNTVFPLYGEALKSQLKKANLPHDTFLVQPGEQSKTLEQAALCWKGMHSKQLDRETLVIGIGGGVVTDLAGFISSCYMRGLHTVYLPTTLLGIVDAAIGGKTGINLPSGKNIIGTFHHPKRVFIIPECLKTLPLKELHSGLAEMIKYGVIDDAQLFVFLEKNLSKILAREANALQAMIQSGCSIKTKIIQADPEEKGLRAILNYGHTFAHAIETATDYQKFLHGEAVSIGMTCAAHVSLRLNLTDKTLLERQSRLCQQAGLPTKLPENLSIDHLIELMKGDKKSKSGKINLIVPEKIGKVITIADVDKDLLREAMMAARQE